jgi:hypothetical protein
MLKQGLATGTDIQNKARIVFDANPPIDTPSWMNTLDATEPASQVTFAMASDCSQRVQLG